MAPSAGATNVTIPSGTKLGRYEIRSQLGAGGMARVYPARTWPQSRFLRELPEFQELMTSIGLPWRAPAHAPGATQEWVPQG